MITLYLVRHGETVHNLEGRIQGHADSPLTPLGVKQAEAAAARLASEKLDAIYSSDLGRAVATAEIISAPHSLSVQTTELIREACFDKVQGLTQKEFKQQYPEDYRRWREDSVHYRPPGAETLESLISRCGEFLQMISEKHKDGERLLAVVHGGSLRGLICAACSLEPTFFRCLRMSNAGISILDLGDRPALSLFNDTCHLRKIRVTEEDADNS
ncbi:histidine phosphatase family protein [bacterium]|nr:histidine phosphatase family protein [bacterium]